MPAAKLPPWRALGLCVDGQPQLQVLDRTQPLLPMGPGQMAPGD